MFKLQLLRITEYMAGSILIDFVTLLVCE